MRPGPPHPTVTEHRIPVEPEPAPIPAGARSAPILVPRRSANRQRSFGTSLVAILLFGLAAPALAANDPVATVDAFHAALAAGDRDGALALLAEDLTVFESGWAERTREEYAAHHLGADMEFSAATEREVVSQTSGEAGEAAWVLTEARTTGTFRDRAISSVGLETMVLRRTEDGWRIVHIHWSSRDLE